MSLYSLPARDTWTAEEVEHFAQALAAYAENPPQLEVPPRLYLCGVVCNAGPNGEPLACAWPVGHDGLHSWASLPTFVQHGQITEEVSR